MKTRRIIKIVFFTLFVFIATVILLSALNNLVTPTRSEMVGQLREAEKARVAEMFHLRQTLGDKLWRGWGEADIPQIVYDQEYAFLIGYSNPPPGWTQVPQMRTQGSEWEPVQDESLEGLPYYRQRLPSQNESPQNFTVLVGNRWVASLQTKEWMTIALGNFFAENMPAFVRPIFPRGFVAQQFISSSDKYISLGLHESFHAYQGMMAPARLEMAERAAGQEENYPFDDSGGRELWQAELNLLAQAVNSKSEAKVRELAQQFLERRSARRETMKLNAGLVNYEKQREWLEGLAKYVELEIWRQAAETSDYKPLSTIAADPDFKKYQTFDQSWAQEVSQITLSPGSKETLLYYSGMAQAVLLDRLMPNWKEHILTDDLMLEDLLRQAIGGTAAYAGGK